MGHIPKAMFYLHKGDYSPGTTLSTPTNVTCLALCKVGELDQPQSQCGTQQEDFIVRAMMLPEYYMSYNQYLLHNSMDMGSFSRDYTKDYTLLQERPLQYVHS